MFFFRRQVGPFLKVGEAVCVRAGELRAQACRITVERRYGKRHDAFKWMGARKGSAIHHFI